MAGLRAGSGPLAGCVPRSCDCLCRVFGSVTLEIPVPLWFAIHVCPVGQTCSMAVQVFASSPPSPSPESLVSVERRVVGGKTALPCTKPVSTLCPVLALQLVQNWRCELQGTERLLGWAWDAGTEPCPSSAGGRRANTEPLLWSFRELVTMGRSRRIHTFLPCCLGRRL